MGLSLGEPEGIYNMHVAIMSRTGWKIMSILLYILKRSVTPWKRYMGFSLGEPERIYNNCAYNITHDWKIVSILLHILNAQ